jgi:hypothetical protein
MIRFVPLALVGLFVCGMSAFAQQGSPSASYWSHLSGEAKVIKISCDQRAARLCQQQVNGCFNICNASNNVVNCNSGCLDRYKECKVVAGCGAF